MSGGYTYAPSVLPPAGWKVLDGQLTPDGTVAGYLARGVDVYGLCEVRDCRRKCHLDFPRMMAKGWGALHVMDLKRHLSCTRFGGCAMHIGERSGADLTLSALGGREYVKIRIGCEGCRKAHLVTPTKLAERLKAERRGGWETSLTKLAGLVRGKCKHCGAQRWSAAVLWYDATAVPADQRR